MLLVVLNLGGERYGLLKLNTITMFSWYPVMDLARAPRRAARKKGSGYENETDTRSRSRQYITRAKDWVE